MFNTFTAQRHSLTAAAIALLALSSSAFAAESPIVTKHEARIAGRPLIYLAEAGRLAVRDLETAEVRGRMFYVAFRASTADDEPRPIMFVWGGGPSGPALGMQMAYGPKTVSEDGRLVDNDLSLLSAADLVFVDPVGTGFSRAEKTEYLAEFYSTTGDARATAEFIRVWIAMNAAERAPIFLNGQSYGVWRAAFTTELLEQSGRRIAGLVLTSGGTGMADDYAERAYEIAYRVPDYAATALHHGRLPPELGRNPRDAWQQAQAWARDTYGPALSRLDQLSGGERESLARDLSRRTGYPLNKIDRESLAFTPPAYLRDFIDKEDARLNTFDMRRVMGEGEDSGSVLRDRVQAQYLREHLGYRTDLAYIGLETGYTPVTSPDYQSVGSRWNYDSGSNPGLPPPDGGPPGKEPWVRRAIDINPDLQVFVEAAVYDSLNFCAANEDRKARMPAELADNFELHCYFAGHGSFRDPDAYADVVHDIRNFIERVTR